jgi:hypothetical protein
VSIVPLLLFCSLCLVAGALVLFVFSSRQGDCHEADRLCLLPLDEDESSPSAAADQPASAPSPR